MALKHMLSLIMCCFHAAGIVDKASPSLAVFTCMSRVKSQNSFAHMPLTVPRQAPSLLQASVPSLPRLPCQAHKTRGAPHGDIQHQHNDHETICGHSHSVHDCVAANTAAHIVRTLTVPRLAFSSRWPASAVSCAKAATPSTSGWGRLCTWRPCWSTWRQRCWTLQATCEWLGCNVCVIKGCVACVTATACLCVHGCDMMGAVSCCAFVAKPSTSARQFSASVYMIWLPCWSTAQLRRWTLKAMCGWLSGSGERSSYVPAVLLLVDIVMWMYDEHSAAHQGGCIRVHARCAGVPAADGVLDIVGKVREAELKYGKVTNPAVCTCLCTE